MKKSKKHDKVVKEAYNLLVCYRRLMDDQDPRWAKHIEETYKELWCECLNEPAPWC